MSKRKKDKYPNDHRDRKRDSGRSTIPCTRKDKEKWSEEARQAGVPLAELVRSRMNRKKTSSLREKKNSLIIDAISSARVMDEKLGADSDHVRRKYHGHVSDILNRLAEALDVP